MNRKIRDQWAKALETWPHPQAENHLTLLDEHGNITGNCCLGVLCELAADAGIVVRIPMETNLGVRVMGYRSATEEEDVNTETLPMSVVGWAGTDDDDPYLEPVNAIDPHDGHAAAHWNDEEGATFADIAAMVRNMVGD